MTYLSLRIIALLVFAVFMLYVKGFNLKSVLWIISFAIGLTVSLLV